jgi:NHL repeat
VCDPRGLAVDAKGNVYVADYGNSRVYKVGPSATITRVAGNGHPGFSGDGGAATSAQLNYPWSVAVDGKGSVYIGDTNNSRVRKVGTTGTANTTFAGFYSPSRNLSCTLADRDPRGTYVYCQSVKAPTNVRMRLNGRLKICRGTRCLGNPAGNTRTLGYGKKVTVGRFRCHSLRSGVRCTVIRSGKGFLISRSGVRRVGR